MKLLNMYIWDKLLSQSNVLTGVHAIWNIYDASFTRDILDKSYSIRMKRYVKQSMLADGDVLSGSVGQLLPGQDPNKCALNLIGTVLTLALYCSGVYSILLVLQYNWNTILFYLLYSSFEGNKRIEVMVGRSQPTPAPHQSAPLMKKLRSGEPYLLLLGATNFMLHGT